MKNLRKIISALLVCSLMLAAVPAFAHSAETANAEKGGLQFGGYAIHDFAENDIGKFINFAAADPSQHETTSVCLTTYAAAYYDGIVYGYVYGYDAANQPHSEFYTMDTRNGYLMNYPGGSADGEFVYGMAYNYADNTMYALCNEDHPYVASVDLESGAITHEFDIELGTFLGLRGFAIAPNGDFYALTMSAVDARLVSVDMTTGALTTIGQTGMPAYYAQSMTFDPATGELYWAQLTSAVSNGLYRVDTATAACTSLGTIGPEGMEITGLYVYYDAQQPEFTPGDADCNGTVNMVDALLTLRAAMNLVQLSDLGELAADMNGDGSITVSDALAIMRMSIGTAD